MLKSSRLDIGAGAGPLPPSSIEEHLHSQNIKEHRHQDILSPYLPQASQLRHQGEGEPRNLLDARVSMSLNARYELNPQVTLPSRLALEPAVNANGNTASRLALESRLPIMLQHCYEPEVALSERGLLTDQAFSGNKRRSPLLLPPPPSFSSSPHNNTQAALLPPPPPQSPPIVSNHSNLSILQESRAIATNRIPQTVSAANHSHINSPHLAHLSSAEINSIRERERLGTSNRAAPSPPYPDTRLRPSATSRTATLSENRAMNLSLSEPGLGWGSAFSLSDPNHLPRTVHDVSSSSDVHRPSPLVAGSLIDSRLVPDPNTNYSSTGSRVPDERQAIPQTTQAVDRSLVQHSGPIPILGQHPHQDLLTTMSSPGNLPFSTAPYLTSSPSFMYPPMFSSSPAASTQLLLPAGDKTYEVLGGSGSSGHSFNAHSQMLVSALRENSLDNGKMVHYSHLESSADRSLTFSSSDQSRSSTDAKYFKRRLSISRSFEEKSVDSLRSSKHHALYISNADSISSDEGRAGEMLVLDNRHGGGGRKSPQSMMEEGAVSIAGGHSVHHLHRLEKPVPLLSSSAARFSLDRKYSDLELAEGVMRSDVVLYPITPSASSASSHGGRSDSSRSPVSRRGSEEQVDHVTVWRPY